MDKDKLVAEMLTAKAEKDNIIDLNAYGNGLADMYDKLVNLCNLPVVTNRVFAVKNTCGDWVNLYNNKEDAEKVASSKNTRLGEMLGFFVDEEEVL